MSISDYEALPQSAKDLIAAYSEQLRRVNNTVRFEIAIYRWEEIQAAIRGEL